MCAPTKKASQFLRSFLINSELKINQKLTMMQTMM
jgi:hypothetical protein